MKHSGGIQHFVRNNKFPLLVAGAWLVLVWGLVFAVQAFFKEPFSLAAWAGDWDGGWYKSIADAGYYSGVIDHQVNVAFFPLLPVVTWLVSKAALLPTVWAGMAVATMSFAAALVVLWHFVNKLFTRPVAKLTLLLLAFNPFSLYFGMFYTESLFLLLAVSAFWFVYTKQWCAAAFFAGLATGTRSVGVAVALAVMAGWLVERSKRQDNKARSPWILWLPQTVILGLIAFSGILAFSAFLWWHTGDPFAYRTVQQFWPGRGGLTNVGNELAYLWEHRVVTMEYALTAMWYGTGVIAFGGLALVVRMRQWLLALYSGIAVSLPILFGTLTGMNRYALAVFPIFIAYSVLLLKLPTWFRVALLTLSVVALGGVVWFMLDPRTIFIG